MARGSELGRRLTAESGDKSVRCCSRSSLINNDTSNTNETRPETTTIQQKEHETKKLRTVTIGD